MLFRSVPGGIPGGVPGGGIAKMGDSGAAKSVKKPLEAVMAQSVFSPDPDQKRLSATKSGTFDKRPGDNKTSFCVNTLGKTVKVKTSKKFREGDDPKVDEICRQTVEKWRFKPFIVGGKPVEMCSTVTFKISFK